MSLFQLDFMNQSDRCLYLFIYQRIKERANKNGKKNVLHISELKEVIGRLLHYVPKSYRYIVIKELEDMGLIRGVNRYMFEITGGNRDLQLVNYSSALW